MNQETLKDLMREIVDNSKNSGGIVLIDELKELLPEELQDDEKIESICAYLNQLGICVIGNGGEGSKELPEEEQEFFEEYLKSCPVKSKVEDIKVEIEKFNKGEIDLRDKIILQFLPYIAKEAREVWDEDFPIMDLIEEGNLALIKYLNDVKKTSFDEILDYSKKGIYNFIKSQKEEFSKDEELVNKVKKLEEYAKEVGEEGKLSVNELAILLDMEIEEIEDIIRLTGEE